MPSNACMSREPPRCALVRGNGVVHVASAYAPPTTEWTPTTTKSVGSDTLQRDELASTAVGRTT